MTLTEAFDQRLFPTLSVAQRVRLRSRIFRLRDSHRVAGEARRLIADALEGIDKPDHAQLAQASNLSGIQRHLRRKTVSMEKEFIAAFLVAECSAHEPVFERYQGWLVGILFRLSEHAQNALDDGLDYHGQAFRAMLALRRMAQAKERHHLKKLDDGDDVSRIISTLGTVEASLPKGLARDRFASIRVLFSYYQSLKKPKTRDGASGKRGRWRRLPSEPQGSDHDLLLTELRPSASEHDPAIDPAYKQNDTTPVERLYEVKPKAGQDANLIRQLINGQRTADRIAAQRLHLNCDWRTITRHEAVELYLFCKRLVITNNNDGALLLLLALLTGRSMERLAALPVNRRQTKGLFEFWHIGADSVALSYQVQLPTGELGERNVDKVGSVIRHPVRMTFPAWITAALLKKMSANDGDLAPQSDLFAAPASPEDGWLMSAKEALASFRKKRHRSIHPGMIRSFLGQTLRQHGVDMAKVATLSGASAEQRASLYYARIIVPELEEIWSTYLKQTFKESPSTDTNNTAANAHTGSKVQVKPNAVADLFKGYREHLPKAPRQTADELTLFHKAYVLSTFQLLAFATGYRAVTAPFADFHHLDLRAGTLWVCDKNNRSNLAARLVPLCPTAMAQIRAYQHHLERLAQLQPVCGDLAVWAGEALSDKKLSKRLSNRDEDFRKSRSAAPFLFWPGEDDAMPLAPELIKTQLQSLWPFPVNWQRHTLRTHLMAVEGLTGDAIDAFMGHADIGEEPWGRESGASMALLRQVSNAIEALFQTLDVQPLPGLGHG